MDQKQALWLSTLLALVATLLLTSQGPMTQAVPVTEGERDKYCSTVLKQTELQEKNCAGAPHEYDGLTVAHLLCCLGSFARMKVQHNYTAALDKSLVLYIYKHVHSAVEEKQVAKFVRQCHEQATVARPLSEDDFLLWTVLPSRCTA